MRSATVRRREKFLCKRFFFYCWDSWRVSGCKRSQVRAVLYEDYIEEALLGRRRAADVLSIRYKLFFDSGNFMLWCKWVLSAFLSLSLARVQQHERGHQYVTARFNSQTRFQNSQAPATIHRATGEICIRMVCTWKGPPKGSCSRRRESMRIRFLWLLCPTRHRAVAVVWQSVSQCRCIYAHTHSAERARPTDRPTEKMSPCGRVMNTEAENDRSWRPHNNTALGLVLYGTWRDFGFFTLCTRSKLACVKIWWNRKRFKSKSGVFNRAR